MQARIEQWLVIWQNTDEFVRTRVRRGWRLSLEQLRDVSSRWMKVRGPMREVIRVLTDAGWFPLTLAGSTGLSRVWWDSAELLQVLSRDILSVHSVRPPTGLGRVWRKVATFPFLSSVCVFREAREPRYVRRTARGSYGRLLVEGFGGGATPRCAG